MNLKKAADLIEEQGRFGDTELVHLNPMEVKWLENMTPGGKLTRNPVTGKKEAWVQLALMAVSTIAGIAQNKKAQKQQEELAQEGTYAGLARSIPVEGTLIEAPPIGEEMVAGMSDVLKDTYGDNIYDTPSFDAEQQIPPELLQQMMGGQEQAQYASSGGPVGLPEDVYHFPVEKISQMQMDVDPGVRNVGNAMMAQMEANPGMGMVGASAAEIDQMAAGGPVHPRRYQDGSEGGITPQGILTTSGYAPNTPSVTQYQDPSEVDPQIREYLELQNSLSGLGTELLHTITTPETPIEQSINTIRGLFSNWNESPDLQGTIFNSTDAARQRMLGREGLSQEERRDLYFQEMEEAEAKQGREDALRAFIEMQRDKRRATGGPVQPRRYDDGGVVQEAIVNTVTDQIPGAAQLKILQAIKQTDDPAEKRRLARYLAPGYGLGEMGVQGVKALGRRIKERPRIRAWRARRRGEDIPEMGPQMRNEGGSVRPKKYQDGSEGGIRELYKKIPTNLRLFGEYLAGVESPITEKDFTEDELDVIRNQIVAQKINNEVLEDEYRKAGDADAVETFEKTRGRTSVSPYDIQESGLPTTKTTFGRSYLSGGSGAVDKGWEESLKSLNDPSYTVATSLGKYTAEDIEDGFRIRENYDFNRGSLDRPLPIQDIMRDLIDTEENTYGRKLSFDQLKNLLATMQATPEVVGETLANMIRSEPRAVDIRL